MQTFNEEPTKMSAKPRPPMCKEHPEEDLRFYCLNCEDTICRDCKIVSHEGHKADIVSNVAKEMRQELARLLDKTEEAISKLKEKEEDITEKVDTERRTTADTMTEVTEIASAAKVEIDKVVAAIECEIKLHDDTDGTEKTREKILYLTTFKESVVQATESDYSVVTAFKQLKEQGDELSGEKTEEQLSTKANIEENLLSDFTQLSEKIVEEVRRFDVKRISSGLPSNGVSNQSQKRDSDAGYWIHLLARRMFAVAMAHIRTRFCAASSYLSKWSLQRIMETGFWLLHFIFCSFPFIQACPILMILFNTYPEVHPVAMMVLSGICVAAGILMLMGNSSFKAGALLYAGILCYLAIYTYLDDSHSGFGTVLIWSRHLGCMGVYLTFTGSKHSKLMLVGKLCITVYLLLSVVLLYDARIRVTLPGGKYTCIVAAAFFTCWKFYMLSNNVVRDVAKSIVCCLVVASSFIYIETCSVDAKWEERFKTFNDKGYEIFSEKYDSHGSYYDERYDENYSRRQYDHWKVYESQKLYYSRYETRLYWTVFRLIVCNFNILISFLVLLKQEASVLVQRLYR